MKSVKLKILLRPTLAIVLAFIGALIEDTLAPATTGIDFFLIIATLAFGTLGFILPEVAEFAGRAGIAVLARQIASHIPTSPQGAFDVARIPLSKLKRPSFALPSRASKGKYVNPILVDTSVLVDGRLKDIVKTGFLFGTLLVLPSVVVELHKLADSADKIKRMRGRRGLDELEQLRSDKKIKIEVLNRDGEGDGVDSKLVNMARRLKAKLLTLDYNLNKVAKISKVIVLNLNELANAAKTVVLPGEQLSIQISAKGAQRQQGVGYLEDGTMVVVEGGADSMGKKADVVVEKVLQTAAGKMVFARIS